jgi:hypothetical protein
MSSVGIRAVMLTWAGARPAMASAAQFIDAASLS